MAPSNAQGTGGDHATACSPQPVSRQDSLAVTFTGIIFAVLLMVVESGLFLEFSTTTSSLIDRSRPDLWIGAPKVSYLGQGSPFSTRKLYQVRAVAGVASAEKYFPRFAIWKHGG